MTDECLVDEQAQLKLNPLLDRQPVQVDCIGQVIPSVHSRVRPVKKARISNTQKYLFPRHWGTQNFSKGIGWLNKINTESRLQASFKEALAIK